MDWEAVSKELQAPLNAAAVKPPPQGKYGEYVEGLHVIREANRIFGHNGWSYTVERLEQTHCEVVELRGCDGPYKQLRTSFLCAVRVVVDGVVREGLAVGVGNGKPESAGDVIESAVKEAETDALKRALRTFGNTFGLALYEKDKAAREVEVPRDPRAIADALMAQVRRCKNYGQINELISGQKFDAAWKWLEDEKPPMANEVKAAVNEMRNKFDPAGQAPDDRAA